MVRTLTLSAVKFQFSLLAWVRAARASRYVITWCSEVGSSSLAAVSNASITRARISEAAFFVNVIARTSSGRATVVNSARILCVSRLVLPEPAGATTQKLRVVSRTSARIWESLIIRLLNNI